MTLAATSSPTLTLGISGFDPADLETPAGLARLHIAWRADLERADPALGARYDALRAGGTLTPEARSALDVEFSAHVSAFVARLFGCQEVVALRRAPVGR